MGDCRVGPQEINISKQNNITENMMAWCILLLMDIALSDIKPSMMLRMIQLRYEEA